ncbi:hypothetical protein M9978_12665 [Sphingomonas sp. MG17]|uniref:Phage integrase family protein n=1 Tax=Sphingomonas tagetis TaxID=2949092 RepID=A0A9X2HSU8_9SPHN|nr:hypothetical protein [Sphingomonas tagetis]MCP3731280.1 hypothetical protein [Sphingomonas tagetis]
MAVGTNVIAALAPAIEGRPLSARLLERWRYRQMKQQQCRQAGIVLDKDTRGAWNNAAEMTRPWREVVAAAELPASTIPYALRHSSIVRGLRAGYRSVWSPLCTTPRLP